MGLLALATRTFRRAAQITIIRQKRFNVSSVLLACETAHTNHRAFIDDTEVANAA